MVRYMFRYCPLGELTYPNYQNVSGLVKKSFNDLDKSGLSLSQFSPPLPTLRISTRGGFLSPTGPAPRLPRSDAQAHNTPVPNKGRRAISPWISSLVPAPTNLCTGGRHFTQAQSLSFLPAGVVLAGFFANGGKRESALLGRTPDGKGVKRTRFPFFRENSMDDDGPSGIVAVLAYGVLIALCLAIGIFL